MKNIIFIFCLILLGCTYPKYEYGVGKILPDNDTLKKELIFNTINSVGAADFQLSTTKYKHPEYVLETAFRLYSETYEKWTDGLYIQNKYEQYRVFIPYERLNENQILIYYNLKDKNIKRTLK
jgi:hypothetical protein